MSQAINTDVCIIGAGPAGAFAALFLARHGVDSVLLDKDHFPRNKICGDGISGWVVSVLNDLDPAIYPELLKKPFVLPSYGMTISAPDGKCLDIPFIQSGSAPDELPPGFVAPRKDLDHYLINLVKKQDRNIRLIEGYRVNKLVTEPDGVLVSNETGHTPVKAKLVIVCNGFNPDQEPLISYSGKPPYDIMLGIKTYVKGITGLHSRNFIELHFRKELLPGYLWIFPGTGGISNVGLGLMRNTVISKKLRLKELLMNYIQYDPQLRSRFEGTEIVAPFEAAPLPLWKGRRPVSFPRIMLAGDAAALVEPVTGEGIGHAAVSGKLAALQTVECLRNNDFSAKMLKRYDDNLYQVIGKELRLSKKIRIFASNAKLFNFVFNKATKDTELQDLIIRAVNDLDARQKLKNPFFYLKLLMKS